MRPADKAPGRRAKSSERHAREHARMIAAALTLAALAFAAAASAQVDPYAAGEQHATQNDLDTEITPVAKKSDLWTLVHGAEHPETEVLSESATTFSTDLFAVAFRNTTIGLAGGSACPREPVRGEGESAAEFGRRVAECEVDGSGSARVPVLYRYSEPPDADPAWERIELPGLQKPGYIGAIAWIDQERALIVGGTGIYPRRELAWGTGAEASDQYGRTNDKADPADPDRADVAGKARAWIYRRSSDSLSELDLSALTRDEEERAGMRGLSALACFEDPKPEFQEKTIELCFAGALGQIWEWTDGRFSGERADAQSPPEDLKRSELLRFRVRDISFDPSAEPPAALAGTSGCCAALSPENAARVLAFEPPRPCSHCPPTDPFRWTVYNVREPTPETFPTPVPVLGGQPVLPEEVDRERRMRSDTPTLPDSIYDLSLNRRIATSYAAVFSPGAVAAGAESPSAIMSTGSLGIEPETALLRNTLSTARLVAADGDVARVSWTGGVWSRQPGGDGMPDWFVGELRSTAIGGLGARGLVVASALAPTLQETLNPTPSAEDLLEGWEPADRKKLDMHLRSRSFLLPSYGANAVDIVGAEEDGWAVGDHGAILRLSSKSLQSAQGATDPTPPNLRSSRPGNLSDRGAYESAQPPAAGETGVVPPLGANTTLADEQRMVPSGSAGGSVSAIVMSRDGSEGWAIANDSGGATFLRYDGVTWSRCDSIGADRASPPDPACEAMASLRRWRNASGNLQSSRIHVAARVPLEYDSDPSNDDELEIVAMGEWYRGPETGGVTRPAVVLYRHGRWRFAQGALTVTLPNRIEDTDSLVFAGPSDGWLANGSGVSGVPYHFDGTRWIHCGALSINASAPSVAACGDTAARGIAANEQLVPGSSRVQVSGVTSAGERVYLFGTRQVSGVPTLLLRTVGDRYAPVILYRDPGGRWTDGISADGDRGGVDPAFADPATTEAGRVVSLSVTEGEDGYTGWAFGMYGNAPAETESASTGQRIPLSSTLLRLGTAGWERFRSPGAFEDYMSQKVLNGPGRLSASLNFRGHPQVGYSDAQGRAGQFIGQGLGTSRIFGFTSRNRFELLDSARPAADNSPSPFGALTAMAGDGRGGFWAAVSGYLFHYTDETAEPVFEEVPNPAGIRGVTLRDISAGPDGSVWLATASDRLFRRDRLTGWEEARIPGWDPGRVVVRASEASALAVGLEGEGVVVGEGGRIANVSAIRIALDPAAGRSCALGDPIPCGTSRDLEAVDIAPDGSAIAAGKRLAVVYRPAGGEFRAAARPQIASSTSLVAVSYPQRDRAFLATSAGIVFRGELSSEGDWIWRKDNVDAGGSVTTLQPNGERARLNDLAIDGEGAGYAVGDGGMVFQRGTNGVWRRVPIPHSLDLTAVELAANGPGVLMGGEDGTILTGSGSKLAVARVNDFPGNFGTGEILGFAYMPGPREGSVDAWAGIGSTAVGEGDDRILRHLSDGLDPVLDPATGVEPLPDVPARADAELSIAAFGKSDCDQPRQHLCPEMAATTTTNETVSERIIDELTRLRNHGEVDLALHSGDMTDSAALPGGSLADYNFIGQPPISTAPSAALAGQLKHRRYNELVANELEHKGIPFLAAIGGQDLTDEIQCDPIGGNCRSTKEIAPAGENFGWREGFAGRAEPWGDGSGSLGTGSEGEITFEPAKGSDQTSIRTEDVREDADAEGPAPAAKAEIGGTSTHYAVDAIRDDEEMARIVFVDTSMRSLAASDPLQQPQELGGGQQRFLERMLCTPERPSSFADRCTRKAGQRAVVVSNTPTYSYGPGALTHTATDATTFEATMLRYDVDLVISGALGYNGLYYTLAPGVHEPCPGEEHPEEPPDATLPKCGSSSAGVDAPDGSDFLSEQSLTGATPTLIAAGAGGKFGPDGQERPDGAAGQWHGYSVAHLMRGGRLIFEQRPILDWIGLHGSEHTLLPGAGLRLAGYGRSAISTDIHGAPRAFHYGIENAAITHRYDLLLADPEEPWLPCAASNATCVDLHGRLAGTRSSGSATGFAGPPSGGNTGGAVVSAIESGTESRCDRYLCLPGRIATIDDQSGQVKAGNGKYPDTYAIAMLSVDEKVATWPLYFKRSPSFVVNPVSAAPAIPSAPPASGSAPPPPAPPSPAQPNVPKPIAPQLPALPGVPPPVAATPPEPRPPAPPAPPPPTEHPSPLSLTLAPPGIAIATPTAVIQPPTPPVNPAPPGGARREARQRQAAAQKSGADSDKDSVGEESMNSGDLANAPYSPSGASMTRHEPAPERRYEFSRHERNRPAPSFTALSRAESGGNAQAVLYTGGATLLAAILALGWTYGRPTPKRRTPELPAPAFAKLTRRRD